MNDPNRRILTHLYGARACLGEAIEEMEKTVTDWPVAERHLRGADRLLTRSITLATAVAELEQPAPD